jgi:tight adherence protein C
MVLLLAPSDIKFSMKITLSMAGSALFFFLPNVAVWRQLKKHRDEIKLHLPEAIDLLEICVTSGIGLDMAWNIVADEMYNVSSILSNAMSLTNFEINLGATRVRAMKNMAERTGVEELSSLAAILIQTERFGTSIADTLRSFANTMREDRSYTAEESAEKLPVKLIIPMALFIFPAVLITLGGPAIIMISKTLLGE